MKAADARPGARDRGGAEPRRPEGHRAQELGPGASTSRSAPPRCRRGRSPAQLHPDLRQHHEPSCSAGFMGGGRRAARASR
ncbi:MAG: hypothetical protein MZW92_22145, partial [Comamonadaceae bacterium]|nr:hypothetical protein [Comamonadaceae bacterium]